MPRKYFRKYLPSHDAVRQNRYLSPFSRFLHHPNLWHLNRHSVSGGVAIGLFSGLVPGPFQMITAALLAIVLRMNLPVALVTTLYTNPFTIAPLYLLAYAYGKALVGDDNARFIQAPGFDWSGIADWARAMLEWTLSLGRPLAVGLVALALTLALLGYAAVQFAWRAWVVLAWRNRRLKRIQR